MSLFIDSHLHFDLHRTSSRASKYGIVIIDVFTQLEFVLFLLATNAATAVRLDDLY
jgi:hypothetical protein